MLIALVSTVLVAAAAASGAAAEIPIAATLNITGPTASQGVLFGNAAKLAVKQINATGGVNGKRINLIPEDAQSSNFGALAALNKAIEKDKALVVLGPSLSTMIQAMSETDKNAGVPFATGGTAVKNTHMGNPWIFRLRPDDSISAAAMIQFIKNDLGLTKVGILHDTDAFGSGGAALLEQYSKEQGITVVKDLGYTGDTKDYTAQLLAIKDAGAQILCTYVPRPEDGALIQRQYHDLALPYKYMGSASNAERDTLALSKDSAAGIYVAIDFMPGVTEESKKYEEAYQKEYGQPADALSAFNYDAINIFAKAIGAAGEDRAKIMPYILNLHGYRGAVGTFDFTPNGDGLHANTIIQVEKGGHLKFLKVVTVQSH